MIQPWLTMLTLIGMFLTAAGAGVAASGVFISMKGAREIAGTQWDNNPALATMLVNQSTKARNGLALIALGTMLQIVPAAAPLLGA